jgi:DnaJ-class molecular chaperone
VIYLVALVAVVVWLLSLIVKPQKACRFCSGAGLKSTRRLKFCRWCGGTGRRFRFGARLIHRGATQSIRYVRENRGKEK